MSDTVAEALEQLQPRLRGPLLRPQDPGYSDARTIWNAMIERHPAAIARCSGAADVMRAIAFARQRGMPLSVRGGGHNIAGSALCDDGLVVDLSQLRAVHVDPIARRARVDGGATLADFDHEAQAFGMATPLGINSTTGVAGLTLGGGFGWLSRKYGLTVDNLVSADVILASGERVRASSENESDLFWALRGGGGNFGVVTEFEYALHPVGPEIHAGLVVYPFDAAKETLRRYRDSIAALSDEQSLWVVLRQAPPLPFLPAAMHGREVVVIAAFCTGGDAMGEATFATARSFGEPIGEHLGKMSYEQWQQAFDPLLTPGARNYWKSHNFNTLPDAALDVLIDYVGALPGSQCEIFLGLLGGQASRQNRDATAYPHRDAQWALNVHARWSEAREDERCIDWARGFYKNSMPFAAGGVYVNFLTADEASRIREAYGGNYERLLSLKQRYDPENLFRANQNIRAIETAA
ncbi:FAD-binding oxidoreductase [Noviherbaspirillum pedocola]|uniref:FAD-binding oxidoreductase n=1 Tax=Noviherbaspirillum pedocola TaxID=2801341 RepID=A0A934SU66_9BURK|nr:FAD-binding oxidoreductase [Noviherbaspirillum pedocola]MBK4736650.1 FAD-binding oxidoreductase [Noviherbaspirillum pedocola]